MIELILGGARSGKSALAQRRAEASGRPVTLIVTAQRQDHDPEFLARIAHHEAQRTPQWKVIEEPYQLHQALSQADTAEGLILIDCLTLWLSNWLCLNDDAGYAQALEAFQQRLTQLRSPVIMVSNETGLGVVPLGELTRRFVDASGRLHQWLAGQAERVTFCVAGLPMELKPAPVIHHIEYAHSQQSHFQQSHSQHAPHSQHDQPQTRKPS
jgi:adenosylcobinamide kinase/adenosylcobinamide-phosphate guanylyltransferase